MIPQIDDAIIYLCPNGLSSHSGNFVFSQGTFLQPMQISSKKCFRENKNYNLNKNYLE